jgi:flagellar biosynthesis chaperone FliJ
MKKGVDQIEWLENELSTLDELIEEQERDLAKVSSELDQEFDPDDFETAARFSDKSARHKKVATELNHLRGERERTMRLLRRISQYA